MGRCGHGAAAAAASHGHTTENEPGNWDTRKRAVGGRSAVVVLPLLLFLNGLQVKVCSGSMSLLDTTLFAAVCTPYHHPMEAQVGTTGIQSVNKGSPRAVGSHQDPPGAAARASPERNLAVGSMRVWPS